MGRMVCDGDKKRNATTGVLVKHSRGAICQSLQDRAFAGWRVVWPMHFITDGSTTAAVDINQIPHDRLLY